MLIVGTPLDKGIFNKLSQLNDIHQLNQELIWQVIEKTNQKSLMQIAVATHYFMAIIKEVPQLIYYDTQSDELIKIALNWQSLTKRIVTAGRKSELILQACKLNTGMTAIDGTAGFGHDGLILASTGATVCLLEKNPVMALLLFYEYDLMSQNKNWQKLLSRINIVHANFTDHHQKADLVYLDPMFPSDSYTAKVGKNMQVLHELASPPTPDEEVQLLSHAHTLLAESGKIVVKRPLFAPHLAQSDPQQSYGNHAIRFDVYTKVHEMLLT